MNDRFDDLAKTFRNSENILDLKCCRLYRNINEICDSVTN